jgi:hypothetical protein
MKDYDFTFDEMKKLIISKYVMTDSFSFLMRPFRSPSEGTVIKNGVDYYIVDKTEEIDEDLTRVHLIKVD